MWRWLELALLLALTVPVSPAMAVEPMRYLALGDSYTIGEAVPETARWPVQMAAALRHGGRGLSDPQIIAATGWTTDELSSAMDQAETNGQLRRDYALVSLLIGVNNQYRGRDLENFRQEFSALLARAIALAGGRQWRVLVLSIPDWGVTRFGRDSGRDTARIAHELDAFNAAAQAECRRRGVAFVDITAVSRRLGARADMQAEDGLHPSAAMYGEWTHLALPEARRLLASP